MSAPAHLLPAGKLPLPLLDELLAHFPSDDPRLVVGPRAGEDAAVLDFGDRYLVAKTDPITFATSQIGWYAVNVNANDIAMMGATPQWFLATVLLPAGRATAELAESIFDQIHDACATLGVSMAGGHTEITVNLDRPIICGTMLGEVAKKRLITSAGARVGDAILQIKPAPIEGAALIALERADVLRQRGYDAGFLARCQGFLHEPGISVVAAAQLALEAADVHAMHDPTEGGVITGLVEMARAARVGMTVDLDAISVLSEGAILCREFGLDPLGTLASGAILLAVAPGDAERLIERMTAAGYPAAHIGQVTPAEDALVALRSTLPAPWPVFRSDEVTKLFMQTKEAPKRKDAEAQPAER